MMCDDVFVGISRHVTTYMCVYLHLYVYMGYVCMYVFMAILWYNTLHTL